MPRYRMRRPRKPRPPITMKVKPAKRNGVCTGCGSRFYKGDEVAYVRHRTKRFHAHSCVPANILTPTPASAVPQLPRDPKEASQHALVALENALVSKAKSVGITEEMEKSFQKYQKIKALALRGATEGEQGTAMRMAMLEIVKLVF